MIIGLNLNELPHPINRDNDGKASWVVMQGDKYLVTGVDRNGRRFRLCFDSWRQAVGINVWRGTKWLVRGGKRYRIASFYN